MIRPPRDSYAAASELAWFSLEKYTELRGRALPDSESTEERLACIRQWAHLIRDRIELKRFYDAGQVEYVRQQFERLMAEPIGGLGFSRKAEGNSTITPVSVKRLEGLAILMTEKKIIQGSVDSMLNRDDLAHLVVDLNASDDQLREDFKRWLRERRQALGHPVQATYREKVRNWHSTALLPYFDLHLFSEFYGRNITVKNRYRLLHPTASDVDLQDNERIAGTLRRLNKLAQRAFTDATASILENQVRAQDEVQNSH